MMYDARPLIRAEQYRTMAAEFRRALKRCSSDTVKVSYRQLAASYEQLASSVEHFYEIGGGPRHPKGH